MQQPMMPDDAMAPEFPRGTNVVVDGALEPAP
jgi:hypothetical protein